MDNLKPLIYKRESYYCPYCDKEMYALMVSELIDNGNVCPWCGVEIRKGSSINWLTADNRIINSSDMTTQHVSNILELLESSDSINSELIQIFENELKCRGVERLPYKPFFTSDIEDLIFRRNNS